MTALAVHRSVRVRTLAGALLVAALVALLASGEARASKIVFACGSDLCAVDPDSGASARITRDGRSSPYRLPSVTRDGRRVAAARGNDVVVGRYGTALTDRWTSERDINDVAIAPDGSGVGESHSYVVNRYGCPLTGGCLELVDMSATSYTPAGGPSEGTRSYPGGGGVGFLGRALLSSRYLIGDDTHRICAVADPAATDASCETRIVSPTTLSGPDGSPDGKLIAAAVGEPAPSEATTVTLFDAATGAVVRRLGAGGSPTFSPDSRHVAYVGSDGWIRVVATRGGGSRRLVRGVSPAWGGGAGPGPALAGRSLQQRDGRVPVAVRCNGSAACRGTVRLAKGRATLGSAAYRISAGRRATVSVPLTARGRDVVAGARSHAVSVRLQLRGGGAVTARATLRR